MKIRRSLWVVLLGCLLAFQPVRSAECPYVIKGLDEVIGNVYVDSGYNTGPCIQAEVMVKKDLGLKKPMLKAYFYNREKKLSDSMPRPSTLGNPYTGQKNFGDPGLYERNQKYTMLFGVRKAIQKNEDNEWHTVLVVFGDSDAVDVMTMPSRYNAQDFDFPEKQIYMKAIEADTDLTKK